MPQPRSIRLNLASVFLLFFLLAGALGLFSISRLSSFNQLSADVAEVWLPNTRTIGDLNNYTSDFRAIEGSNLLSTDPAEIAATERQMEELDRLIARAERSFERIRHDPDEARLYAQFTEGWNEYRRIVNQMLTLSRADGKAEAIRMYQVDSRAAYNAASDTLGLLTDRIVATSRAASDRLTKAYRSALWLIWLAIAIAGVMVAAALAFISRTISAPLLNLASSMHRLAANDTGVHIPGTARRDEIGEMARATLVFRDNAIELMRSQQALARQASGLEEQLAKEQRLALLQRNFVSMASHEFRTPLTIIDGHARRLMRMKDTVEADEIGQRAGKIRSAVLRMTHLIDNLLNSSRLVDGATRPHIERIELDLNALLREVCQLHRETGSGAAIVERLARTPLQMRGDPKLLYQAFSNLLSNAIKYSPGGDPIDVTADEDAGNARIAIADHGIGIPASDLERLFERYHRGSNVSGIVGTGVGLYLVKMVVELHGGTIEVESEEGKGSRFTVRLPLRVAGESEHVPAEHAAA
jgi:signal transduction histidine kinase